MIFDAIVVLFEDHLKNHLGHLAEGGVFVVIKHCEIYIIAGDEFFKDFDDDFVESQNFFVIG